MPKIKLTTGKKVKLSIVHTNQDKIVPEEGSTGKMIVLGKRKRHKQTTFKGRDTMD